MRLCLLVCNCVLGLVLAGCAGYKLGPTGGAQAGARSVQVNLFQNQTPEPRLIEAVATAMRRSLQQDGTYKLNTSSAGDIIVNGVITSFDRAGLSYNPSDILTVRDYWLAMTAKITAYERKTGKVLFEQDVTGRTTIPVGSDLASAERQAIPLLAADLANKTTSLLADGVW